MEAGRELLPQQMVVWVAMGVEVARWWPEECRLTLADACLALAVAEVEAYSMKIAACTSREPSRVA